MKIETIRILSVIILLAFIFIDQEQYIWEVAGYSDLSTLSTKLDQLTGINN